MTRIGLVLACAAAVASCGGGGSASSPLDDALRYLPADAPLAVAIRTDVDSRSYRDLDAALKRFGVQGGLDAALEGAVSNQNLSFSRDIKPLLDNAFVIGVLPGTEGSGPRYMVAIKTKDGGRVRKLLESVPSLEKKADESGAAIYGPAVPKGAHIPEEIANRGPRVAVKGDMVLASDSQLGLTDSLHQRAKGGLTEKTFLGRLGDLPKDGVLRATGDLPAALRALGIDQTTSVPWMGALRSFGLTLNVTGRTFTGDGLISTDRVQERDLPIAPGPSSSDLPLRRQAIATRDQSQTMRFAIDVVRASVPQATFGGIERTLEKKTHVQVGTLVEQFGSGLVANLPTGETISRSDVRDPSATAGMLRSIAKDEPVIARLADAGGPVGQALQQARYLIPALPVPQNGYFPEGSKVHTVAGHPDLYVLESKFAGFASSGKFFFGLVDGALVSAPSLTAAQQAAKLKLSKSGAPPGSIAVSFPLRPSDVGLSADVGGGITLTTIKAAIEASPQNLRLRVRAQL